MSSTPPNDTLLADAGLQAAPKRLDSQHVAPSRGADVEASPDVDRTEGGRESTEARLRALAKTLGIAFQKDLGDWAPSFRFIERVPIHFARQYALLGIADSQVDDAQLTVAVGDFAHWQQLDVLSRHLRCELRPVLVPLDVVLSGINTAYQQQTDRSQTLVEDLDARETLEGTDGPIGRDDLLDSAARPPVVKLVNSILFEAVKARASDVHVQPQEEKVVVRQRIDGVLFDALEVPKDYQEEIISRLKVLGRMNIAEKRLPQDGRATVHVGDRLIDLRIASLPTSFGERVVVRFLDKSARLYTLGELGMSVAVHGGIGSREGEA